MTHHLSKEITVILMIKLIAIFFIWYFFFSAPPEVSDISDVILPQ